MYQNRIICDICETISEGATSGTGEFPHLKGDKVSDLRLTFNKITNEFHVCHNCIKIITDREFTDEKVGSAIIKEVVEILRKKVK